MQQNEIFKGLRVIELASVLAGPAVGMFFAELGAEVIKIENKNTGGDITRQWKLPKEALESKSSAYYSSVNWNKESRFLDLSSPADLKELLLLIKTADILISNLKEDALKKFGLDYPSIKIIHPEIIYAFLNGFGPGSKRPAFDAVLQAEAGFLHMSGQKGGPPAKMPVALIDLMAAHQLKEALLVALYIKERTQKGAFIQSSLLQSAISSLANQATNWLMAGHVAQKMGCKHPNIAPYGDIFFTKENNSIILAVGTENQFKQLCFIINKKELIADPRFNTNSQRVKNRKELCDLLAPLILPFEKSTFLNKCEKYGVPAGSIRNMKEVFELKEAQEMILEETSPEGEISKRVKTVAFEIKINDEN